MRTCALASRRAHTVSPPRRTDPRALLGGAELASAGTHGANPAQGSNRAFEGVRGRLWYPLGTRLLVPTGRDPCVHRWARQDSNLDLTDYESAALTD
jgi:hypothetical protein